MRKDIILAIVLSSIFIFIFLYFNIDKISNRNKDISADLRLELIAEGFSSSVYIAESPDDTGRLFVVDRIGEIRIITEDGVLLDKPFLDIKDRMIELRESYDERGLLGLAFHPDFKENGRFFVYYSAPLDKDSSEGFDHVSRLSEFKVSEDSDVVDIDTEKNILSIDEPQLNHDGGHIEFGDDGFLYIGLGDGGAANDIGLGHPEDGNGQNISTLLGSILRIDVSSEGSYSIPSDNPFVDVEGMDEIYAYGFRNPFKFSFDEGKLYVADVGQNLLEEVDIVEKGKNYGWNVMEGSNCFNPDSPDTPKEDCDKEDLVLPMIEYPHEDGNISGKAIIGGYIYRGTKIGSLYGKYVFADWSSSFSEPKGKIFIASYKRSGWDIMDYMNTDSFILSLGKDSKGELYILTSDMVGPSGNTGKVYKIVA